MQIESGLFIHRQNPLCLTMQQLVYLCIISSFCGVQLKHNLWTDTITADVTVVLYAGATVTVLLPTFYGHITPGHISCLWKQSRAKPTGSLWVARVLELVYMLVVLFYILLAMIPSVTIFV